MKKSIIGLLSLAVIILLSSLSVSFAENKTGTAPKLTYVQKVVARASGFPASAESSMQKWYDILYESMDPTDYGNTKPFNMFLNFCNDLRDAQDPNLYVLSSTSMTTRGVYCEISNHTTNQNESVKGIFDCLVNRYRSKNFGSAFLEVSINALNGINPNISNTYWPTPVQEPILDAVKTGDGAMRALVQIYLTSYRYYDKGLEHNGTIGPDYFYFLETPRGKVPGHITVGNFDFNTYFIPR